MQKGINWICTVLLLAILWADAGLSGYFPVDAGEKISAKYAGWSGVLRVCVRENVASTEVLKVLKEGSKAFERSHSGVYVEISVGGDENLTDIVVGEEIEIVADGERVAVCEEWTKTLEPLLWSDSSFPSC